MSMTKLSRRVRFSLSGVSFSVKRGEKIAQDNGYAKFGDAHKIISF